ncbi:hypothetical protein [Azorhizobium caulinodans]|uniref:hypothetical protein n=1 Tax=Azorhizobium caulinodans TaxID=7 RepID=UPI002FBDB222
MNAVNIDTEPNIFVAGMGRCGTTMVMTMLDRGGFPVGDRPPAYEAQTPMVAGNVKTDALRPFAGMAIKWIDPTISRAPAGMHARTIFLHRDPIEQAKSQLKLMGMAPVRRHVRTVAASIRRDTEKCQQIVRALGPCLFTSFERILSDPAAEAVRMEAFLADPVFDPARAAAAVRPRSAACAPDLSLELSLMQEPAHV